jgi:hypothetical protein
MAISSYLTDDQLRSYLTGSDTINPDTVQQTITKIMSTTTNGIEGLPYQFMASVDRRIPDTDVGRKYGDRIKISMIRRKVHGYHEKIWDTWKAALPLRGSAAKNFFKR